jgi:hypothetical protein
MVEWTTVLASLAASGLISAGTVTALSRYLGDRWTARYKAGLDQQLELYKDALERKRKRIEAELGHRTYVGKAQFDCEYHALKDCFAALGRLRLGFNGLRPLVDWLPDDQSDRVRLVRGRLEDFKQRYNPLVDTVASVYPFVPEDIYDQFEKCMKAAILEIKQIEQDTSKALTSTGYNEGAKHRDSFESAYFNAARLARERFHQLSIVPD